MLTNIPRNRHCHALVKKTAEDFAARLFEEQAKNNAWYDMWQKAYPNSNGNALQKKFVELKWPLLIQQARDTLTDMLVGNLPESLKEEIADALIKDKSLNRGVQGSSFKRQMEIFDGTRRH